MSRTFDQTLEDLALRIAERLGKTPVVVGRDAPGFIVNRPLWLAGRFRS